MLNVLRLTDDFAEADFEARTGVDVRDDRRARSPKRSAKRLLQRAGAGGGG